MNWWDGETVSNRSEPAEVLELMIRAAAQEAPAPNATLETPEDTSPR